MSKADLVADLKASLHDAASVFTAAADADFDRLLSVAGKDMGHRRPLLKSGTLTLVADTAAYSAPSDLVTLLAERWSVGRMPQPWEATWCGPLPRQSVIGPGTARQILFTPAPSAAQLAVLGSSFVYDYRAEHIIDAVAGSTTIAADDRGLLLLRAQAEAMREIALRNSAKPVALRDGLSGAPKNGAASYLYEALLNEYREAA
jgi:hypothetical protein